VAGVYSWRLSVPDVCTGVMSGVHNEKYVQRIKKQVFVLDVCLVFTTAKSRVILP
jgi:hypothetical protein